MEWHVRILLTVYNSQEIGHACWENGLYQTLDGTL